MPRDQNARDET